jgi:hypothetical protein
MNVDKDVVTYELSKLLDETATASEWNDAIETAITTIENLE